jgi:hypothetical protein
MAGGSSIGIIVVVVVVVVVILCCLLLLLRRGGGGRGGSAPFFRAIGGALAAAMRVSVLPSEDESPKRSLLPSSPSIIILFDFIVRIVNYCGAFGEVWRRMKKEGRKGGGETKRKKGERDKKWGGGMRGV